MTEGRQYRENVYTIFDQAKDGAMKIESWLETHPINFSIKGLAEELGVSLALCRKVVESSPLVIINEDAIGRPGPQKRYKSIAIIPEPTSDGIVEEFLSTINASDELGRDARADFYELIRVRTLALHYGRRKWRE